MDIQLVSLDGQHGLEIQYSGKGRCGRCDPAALFQILHGVHRDINTGVIGPLFQEVLDLPGTHPLLRQLPGASCGCLLGDGDAVVVHHLAPSLVLQGKLNGIMAGIAEPAGHGDIDDLIISVLKNALPKLQKLPRRRLGRGNILMQAHGLVKLRAGDVRPLQIHPVIYDHGHRQKIDPLLVCLLLRHAAVCISCDSHFLHWIAAFLFGFSDFPGKAAAQIPESVSNGIMVPGWMVSQAPLYTCLLPRIPCQGTKAVQNTG